MPTLDRNVALYAPEPNPNNGKKDVVQASTVDGDTLESHETRVRLWGR
jgi:hypothetical protein